MPNSPFRVSTEMDITISSQVGHVCLKLLVITTRMVKPFCELSEVCLSAVFFLEILKRAFCFYKLTYQWSCSSPAAAWGHRGNQFLPCYCLPVASVQAML